MKKTGAVVPAILVLIPMLLTGCCSTKHVADPKDITLKNALISVATSLDAMRTASKDKEPFGLFPQEVEVTFNISASRSQTSELHVDLSAPATSPVTASAGGKIENTSTAARGNQITIKFGNIMTLDPESTLLGKQGSDIIKLIQELNDAGIISKRK
jgi:murein DD-endopeptidase MepM/ murein hydrolase activator NlpD